MAKQSVHGRFLWQDLMTARPDVAATFYPAILGWDTEPAPNSPDYTIYRAAHGPVAGFMQHEGTSHWVPHIGADDLEATVARAQALGATVLRAPTDIEHIGRFAVIADPQGAAVTLFEPRGMPVSPAGPPKLGDLCWHELVTTQHEDGLAFYRTLFGWEQLAQMDMGEMGTYLIFGRDGVQMGGAHRLPSSMTQPYWLAYVSVADADDTVARARAAGATVMHGPASVPGGGRIAQMLDPAGVLFAVHSAPPAAPATRESASRPVRAKRAPAKPAATRTASAPAAAAPRPRAMAKAKPTPKAKAKANNKAKSKARAKPVLKSKTKAKTKTKTALRTKPKGKSGRMRTRRGAARRAATPRRAQAKAKTRVSARRRRAGASRRKK